jgi:glycosyltransferase involved in cell wall biosynthesis
VSEAQRRQIGIWSELRGGQRWKNEGVSRVIGFIIEGAARRGKYCFHLVVQNGLAEEVRDDLRSLQAREGVDWVVHEPTGRDVSTWLSGSKFKDKSPVDRIAACTAEKFNRELKVEGWIVSFPHFEGALHLEGPKAVLMPDAIGYDFPDGWLGAGNWGENGYLVNWRHSARKVLAGCQTVMTFSQHVADRHVVKLLDTPREKIVPIPLAPPDLADLLSFVEKRKKTTRSVRHAANLLRGHAINCGDPYLFDFPFEEVPYIATATQDRPTKNLGRVAEAIRKIVRDRRGNMKLLTTARINYGEMWSLLPQFVENSMLNRDVISMPDMPREVHAALFHAAAVTVHPTLFEGIIGSLPLYESLSVGTPCILARGPHVKELLDIEPSLEPFTFDPYDTIGLANLIEKVSRDPQSALNIQMPMLERLLRYDWGDVADAYVRAATIGAGEGPDPAARRFGQA